MPYLIEAFVQDAPDLPYVKIIYVSNNSDIDYHQQDLLGRLQFHQVLSVKSYPADEMLLNEFSFHGNMRSVDGVPVIATDEDIVDESSDSNT